MSSAEWVAGFHAVLAALEQHADRVEVVWIADNASGSRVREILELARKTGTRFQTVPRHKLGAVAGVVAHNGVAVRLAPTAFADPDALIAAAAPACVLGLDGVSDGHNLGAVVRSAAAFGLAGVVVAGPHPPPLGGAAAKVAAGTLPLVRVAHVGSLGDFAMAARRQGFWVLGAEVGGAPVEHADLPERLVLCLGGEASGLRAKTRHALDGSVSIPMASGVESLNLSVAAAILAWEWRRRYALAPSKG
ncbi:MAG: TrmH family RNA methyltransferase [Thermoanaerobaculales bacterium]